MARMILDEIHLADRKDRCTIGNQAPSEVMTANRVAGVSARNERAFALPERGSFLR
jgi:hypothetical protein